MEVVPVRTNVVATTDAPIGEGPLEIYCVLRAIGFPGSLLRKMMSRLEVWTIGDVEQRVSVLGHNADVHAQQPVDVDELVGHNVDERLVRAAVEEGSEEMRARLRVIVPADVSAVLTATGIAHPPTWIVSAPVADSAIRGGKPRLLQRAKVVSVPMSNLLIAVDRW